MAEVTKEDRYAANKELAGLLGWHNVELYGDYGHMIGNKASNGKRIIPLWTESWDACGKLIAEHGINLDFSKHGEVLAAFAREPEAYHMHPSMEAAVRYAAVQGAISKLKEAVTA